jgi:hypothetical protein
MPSPATPQDLDLYQLWRSVGVLVGFQITVLGWRILREQKMSEAQGNKIWFPVADYMNIFSIAISMVSVFIVPMVGQTPRLRMWMLGMSLMLFTAFPFALVGHYEIFTPNVRHEATYFPRQERIVFSVTLFLLVGFSVWYWIAWW